MALTQLSAVNDMLASVGTPPLTSLTPPLSYESTFAVNLLERVRVEILSEGWHWNTDVGIQWDPDGNDNITPDTNALSFRENEEKSSVYDLTLRGGQLWDKFKNTDEFPGPVYVNVIRDIPFDEMIESAKRYVAAKALHTFQARVQEGRVQFPITQHDVTLARAALMSEDSRAGGLNFFTNRTSGFLAGRVSPLDRRSF